MQTIEVSVPEISFGWLVVAGFLAWYTGFGALFRRLERSRRPRHVIDDESLRFVYAFSPVILPGWTALWAISGGYVPSPWSAILGWERK